MNPGSHSKNLMSPSVASSPFLFPSQPYNNFCNDLMHNLSASTSVSQPGMGMNKNLPVLLSISLIDSGNKI